MTENTDRREERQREEREANGSYASK